MSNKNQLKATTGRDVPQDRASCADEATGIQKGCRKDVRYHGGMSTAELLSPTKGQQVTVISSRDEDAAPQPEVIYVRTVNRRDEGAE